MIDDNGMVHEDRGGLLAGGDASFLYDPEDQYQKTPDLKQVRLHRPVGQRQEQGTVPQSSRKLSPKM